ncbi:uncharacterized protein LOC126313398 [Schistocerca gregaria]|uniref:uncharacterized protein LOC126313398 n=1 Tax=Schistocerca gregaria TaxID=7010 RepID=UPI00211E9A9C|nr:uncharacterized protein LOC126313398 [Schistocerca gregaria]
MKPSPFDSDPLPKGNSLDWEQPYYRTKLGLKLCHQLSNRLPEELESIECLRDVAKFVLVTDSNIDVLYGANFRQSIAASYQTSPPSSRKYLYYVIQPSESSKSRETKANVEDWMIRHTCNRDTCIVGTRNFLWAVRSHSVVHKHLRQGARRRRPLQVVLLTAPCAAAYHQRAIGGGVVGDVAGFVAATFLRGIPFVQVPTTLLAMVDSSIGGKTGINTPQGKNLIGAFHMPAAVLVDLSFLTTLPLREFYNGMAEIVKIFAACDASAFDEVRHLSQFFPGTSDRAERTPSEILSRLPSRLIFRAIEIKAYVVSKDATETCLRSILNYGHTVGHAIEASVSHMLHGECVSVGMILEAKVAQASGHLVDPLAILNLSQCLRNCHLPIELPKELCPVREILGLIKKMKLDKKNARQRIRMTMLTRIGHCLPQPVPVNTHVLRSVLHPFVCILPPPPEREVHAAATLAAPGSKSISNRVLAMCALGRGTCRIKGLLHAEDTYVMIQALKDLGTSIEYDHSDRTWTVHGSGGKLTPRRSPHHLHLENSGVTSRFLTTICTLLAKGTKTVITGSNRLKERPIKDLVDALINCSREIRYLQDEGSLPIEVTGTRSQDDDVQRNPHITVKSELSSQFVSSLLISAPYMSGSLMTIHAPSRTPSSAYVEMTVGLMRQFGINVQVSKSADACESSTFRINSGVYQNPAEWTVEPDASSISYLLSIAAITGGRASLPMVPGLQGDAQFALQVLEPMGCAVSLNDDRVEVRGPSLVGGSGLKALGTISMDSMTDAFMAASALAAVASGTTRIVNVANQRLKECDRIRAVATELKKIGFCVKELDDGLEIAGIGGDLTKLPRHNVEIECHNDHRIAMCFAVLGSRVPNLYISDKDCVNKTFPTFWTTLRDQFKLTLLHQECPTKAPAPAQCPLRWPPNCVFDPASPILLIGMRGCGKTTMGQNLASELNRPFVDLDQVFADEYGAPIGEFTKSRGLHAFRSIETSLLVKTVLELSDQPVVIAAGGGVVETEENQKFIKQIGQRVLIIQISSDLSSVHSNLTDTSPHRADLGEHLDVTWQRRQPIFLQCSHYEYYLTAINNKLSSAPQLFSEFVKRILRGPVQLPPYSPTGGTPSFFLSLTLPEYGSLCAKTIATLVQSCHALEARIDLLHNHRSHDVVRRQISTLRELLHAAGHSQIPLIYTVRTKQQGGLFTGDERELFALLQLAIRLGCEYVDMEACWSKDRSQLLLNEKRCSRILVSMHDLNSAPTGHNIQSMFEKCLSLDNVDVVKVVASAQAHTDGIHEMLEVSRRIKNAFPRIPMISIVAGEQSKLTRITNSFLTPVTHPLLPFKAAPGQCSADEIMSLRKMLGLR